MEKNKTAEKLKKMLLDNRRTGRTGRMLEQVLESMMSGENLKFVVFAHSPSYAKDLMTRFVDMVPVIPLKVGHDYVEIGSNIVLFKTKSYQDTPSFKYQKWTDYFTDHYVYDLETEKHIQWLESELVSPEYLEKERTRQKYPKF